MGFWRKDVIQPGLERDTDAAIAEQQAILKADPHNSRAHFALGTLYYFKAEHELAINCFESAIVDDPTYAAPHASLGRICAVRGWYDLAWRHAQDAARLGDSSLLEQLERYPSVSPTTNIK